MAGEERLDEGEAIDRLNEALVNQYRSALQYSITASSLLGIEAQAVGEKLTEYGDEELAGARLLIEKIVSFGGAPTTEVAELHFQRRAEESLAWLIRCEEEGGEALKAALE